MLYTRLASPVAVCIAIRGRYIRLAWLANSNPTLTLHTASRVTIRLAVCIDTFLYETSQFQQIVMIQLNCIKMHYATVSQQFRDQNNCCM